MEEEVNKVLEQLNSKHANQTDLQELEKCFRELVTELHIKTNQVGQLKSELEETSAKNHELKKALDLTKNSNQENEFNANLIMKKFKSCEQQLLEKRDSLMKIQMLQKMTQTELDHIKDTLQKMSLEKAEITRKNEALEVKHQNDTTYYNEIQRKQNQFNSFMGDVQECMTKLQTEQEKVAGISEKLKLSEVLTQKCDFLVEEGKKIKTEKEYYEDLYIKINAKYEKLAEMINAHANINEPSLLTKIIFDQWTQQGHHFEKQTNLTNETIKTLNEALAKEKEANVILMFENDNLEKKISEQNITIENLEKTTADLQKKREVDQSEVEAISTVDAPEKIKDEPIEILDD